MTSFSGPYIDVRVERPHSWEWIGTLPGLVSIDLDPPASGPEIELTFGTAVGCSPAKEEDIVTEVEQATLCVVLASRRRNLV
jgi:hypothetical protein